MHRRQLEVADNVCQQIRAGSAAITGVMAESFLVEGTQKIVAGQPLTYGQSITDPCLSWSDSEQLLRCWRMRSIAVSDATQAGASPRLYPFCPAHLY
ncbi:Phospho-2-dehydro-3-deoxyheptonate aldolase, Phe-sensitive [Serratia marcescens]|nr:Phospho-2-dehydro-3-deoxyheptonate aldolase, Phe-sensitive [Serratia marcescens]